MDYDVVFDNKSKSVTISATYYVDEKNKKSADAAVKKVNDLGGKHTYSKDGIEYTINFSLSVKPVESPMMELNLDKFGRENENGVFSEPLTNSNIYSIISDDEQGMKKDAGGDTRQFLIRVKESYKEHYTVGTHEILHSLGVGHSAFGIMSESIHDKGHSPAIFSNQVRGIIDSAIQGQKDVTLGIGTVK
jgi:hypothetical protein